MKTHTITLTEEQIDEIVGTHDGEGQTGDASYNKAINDVIGFIERNDLIEDCGRLIATPRRFGKQMSERNQAWIDSIRNQFL